MDLKTAIESRRTIHEFSGEKVEQGLVEEALKLALWAPNHKLTYPWKFYDVGYETKAKLIDLAASLKQKNSAKPLTEMMIENLKTKLSSCSHMIAIGLKKCESEFQQREDYATVSCGLQNTCLFLHEQGVGTKWSTGGFTRSEDTYKILNVDPDEIEIVGVLLIGKAKCPAKAPPRPDFAKFYESRS